MEMNSTFGLFKRQSDGFRREGFPRFHNDVKYFTLKVILISLIKYSLENNNQTNF